jgi:hypothetical protein
MKLFYNPRKLLNEVSSSTRKAPHALQQKHKEQLGCINQNHSKWHIQKKKNCTCILRRFEDHGPQAIVTFDTHASAAHVSSTLAGQIWKDWMLMRLGLMKVQSQSVFQTD